MGKKLVSRTAKVLSETKKTKDKEAVAVAYEHIPRNPEEQQHGSIYAVIEIEDKSGHAEEIAEKIIDILHDTYYDDTTKDALAAFEESLAKINDELADRSSEGQINWIGKLNSVLAILSGNTFHVTQAGKAEAYLYRGEHTMHITEDLSGDSINPQRTFINIASGELAEKDKIALLTPGVFYKISKHELKNFVIENSPIMAIESISKLLSGENGTVKPNAILVMELLSPESFIADEEAEEKSEVWVKEDKNIGEEIGKGVAGGTAKAIGYLGAFFAAASSFAKTKALPGIKKTYIFMKKKAKDFLNKDKEESIILSSEEKISTKVQDLGSEVDIDDGILETPIEKEKEIRIKETRKKPKLLSLERFDFSFLERAKDNLTGRAKRLRIPGGKLSYLYLIGAIAILIGLFTYLGYSNTIKKDRTAAENKINQATELYNEAVSNITSGQYALASSNIDSAKSILESVLNTKYFTNEANDLITKINSIEDEAQRVTRNTASLYYEFNNDITNIFSADGIIYGVNFTSGSVYSIDSESGTESKIVENPDLGGEISAATLIESRNILAVYTTNKEVFEFNLENGEISKQNVPGSWEDAVALDSFGTNIYLLSPNDEQIYKHFKIASGYGVG